MPKQLRTEIKKEAEVVDYIKKVWCEIVELCSLIKFYQIIAKDEKRNDAGGWCGVRYEPTTFQTDIYIYKDIFTEEMPKEGLTKGFKSFIKQGLCHEAGHIYIWELEGGKTHIEKTASQIGMLTFEILENRDI